MVARVRDDPIAAGATLEQIATQVVRAVQLALLLLIGASTYPVLRTLLGLREWTTARAKLERSAVLPAPREAREEPAYVAFALGDPFGAFDEGLEADDAVVGPPLETTRLQIVLLGTTIDSNPARSTALIRDTDARSYSVGPGTPIAGGRATVERIERARVVIAVGERLEAVAFDAPRPTNPITR